MLKIQFKDKRQPAVWIVEKRYTIGSAADNHLCLDDEGIDALHARVLTLNNSLVLQDNNSRLGCYVNGQRITKKELLPGDCIRLGPVEFDILNPYSGASDASPDAHPWLLLADSGTLAGREFPLLAGLNLIGRGSQCDISIPASQLARQHAEIVVEEQQLRVRDLNSASGVYVNEERISEGLAKTGDRLRLDIYSFKVIGPDDGDKKRARRSPSATLQPVARRTVALEPKRWKTKSTSPGNRIEPETGRRSHGPLLLGLLLCGLLASVLVYLWWAN